MSPVRVRDTCRAAQALPSMPGRRMSSGPVSYTHLDVYKRQEVSCHPMSSTRKTIILGFFPETGLEPLPRADAPANRNNAPQTADIIQEVNFMRCV